MVGFMSLRFAREGRGVGLCRRPRHICHYGFLKLTGIGHPHGKMLAILIKQNTRLWR